MRWFRCLHYPDEEVFKASTSKTDQSVDVQANQSSYGSRDCVDFALTLLIFFFFCYIDDFTAKSKFLHLHRAVSLMSLRRNGKPVK